MEKKIDIFITLIREIKMISHKRSTILAITLLSVTLLTTGCIQKKELVIDNTRLQQQPQQQISVGAKTIPYTAPIQQTVQYTQRTEPTTQYIEQSVQPIIEPTVQYTLPQPQSTETKIQYLPESSTTTYEDEECTDDISTNGSNCDRGSIDKTQLSTNYSPNSSGGTMHTLKTLKGKTIKIGERSNGFTFPNYPGKVIILEMFGQNCPHCIKEVPILKKLKSRYGNKLEVIGIHSQGILSPSAGRRFVRQHRVNYPINSGLGATDLQYFIQNTYGWTGILPFTMIIKDGQTEGSFGGETSYQELREVLDPLF